MKTLHELSQLACKELPEHWELIVSLERGAGIVSLYDPQGDHAEDANEITESLEDQIIQALGYAKANCQEKDEPVIYQRGELAPRDARDEHDKSL